MYLIAELTEIAEKGITQRSAEGRRPFKDSLHLRDLCVRPFSAIFASSAIDGRQFNVQSERLDTSFTKTRLPE